MSISNNAPASTSALTTHSRARTAAGALSRAGRQLRTRHGSTAAQLLKFGLVGGSGVLVNMAALVAVKHAGPAAGGILAALPATSFNLRWYHLYFTVSFLVANLYNFALNRRWTFRSSGQSSWLREYGLFLSVGAVAFVVGLGLATLLIHPGTFLSLPAFLDNSSGLRDRAYWANLIQIGVTVPLSFVLNKFWTFSAVRTPAT